MSPNVQLEGLEPPTQRAASGTPHRAALALLGADGVDALLAQAADALGTGVGLLELVDALAAGAVDLHGVRGCRGAVAEALGGDVEVCAGHVGEGGVDGG